jgi:hypothetical protein
MAAPQDKRSAPAATRDFSAIEPELAAIAKEHRVAIKRDGCGDPVIPGRNGHLYIDAGETWICYTDDGRKRPLTIRQKTYAMSRLRERNCLLQVRQEGDFEFLGRIAPEGVGYALFQILGVKRFKATKGVSKPMPAAALAAREKYHRERREKAE